MGAGGAAAHRRRLLAALAIEFVWLRASYARDSRRPADDAASCSRRGAPRSLIAPRVFLLAPAVPLGRDADFVPAERAWSPRRASSCMASSAIAACGIPGCSGSRGDGIPFVAVTLEPPFGSIDRYRRDDRRRGRPARERDRNGAGARRPQHGRAGDPGLAGARQTGPARFHRVVTIGTPHRRHLRSRAHARTRNGIEMRSAAPGSKRSARAEGEGAYDRFTCFWGHCDNIVFPTRSATLPGADNRHLAGTPHVAMAFHPDVLRGRA